MLQTMKDDLKDKRQTVAIVGGGLVGALAAIYFAKNGFQVNLFESRNGKQLLHR